MRKQNKIKTVINGQEVTVEQDSQTGQFFTRQNVGNIPIDYATISDSVTIGQCIKRILTGGTSRTNRRRRPKRGSHVGKRTPQTTKTIPVATGRTTRL